jgi:hypothetical protein
MPLIIPANTLSGGYEVANSCRFNDGDSAYMHKTPGSAGNRRTFTISCWVKRGQTTTNSFLFSAWTADNDAGHFAFGFESAERLTVDTYSTNLLTTTRVFRDPSAWYHVVCAVDTTQGTANNRVRLYVNGTEETVFSTRNNPSEDADLQANNSVIQAVGANYYNSQANVTHDGYIAEFCMIDGQQLTPTSFGEFDEDSPTIWKPKNVSGLTFGTNGFYLDFEDSANLGNDANGGTDLTEVNLAATDQAIDTCTNNYATLNPLALPSSANTFSEGNLIITNSADANRTSFSTIGVSGGKWYCEAKFLSGEMKQYIGISKAEAVTRIGESANSYGFAGENARKWNNDSYGSYGSTASTGDIIMVAFDADNGTIWVGKNGTWFASATEAEIEAGTTTNAMYSSITIDDFFFIGASVEDSNIEMNFGSPPYSISSSNSDKNGYGSFEYSVPDSFLSLCTKNLGSDGG